jgi:hypothetical protein
LAVHYAEVALHRWGGPSASSFEPRLGADLGVVRMPMTSTFAAPVRTAQQPLPVVARIPARQPDGKPQVGNQAALHRLSAVAPRLQAGSKSARWDPLEHEADAVADAVMGMAERTVEGGENCRGAAHNAH